MRLLPFHSSLLRPLVLWVGLLGGIFGSILGLGALDIERLRDHMQSRYGPAAVSTANAWERMLTISAGLGEADKVKRVNDFINQHIRFEDDIVVWNQSDYWATPAETLGRGMGDCEDFSIIKYFTLKQLGVPVSKLRLIYVKANLDGQSIAHMVLAYYAHPNAEPLVLDNLIPDIQPASRRTDLFPIFSFNSEGLWMGTGNSAGKSKLSRWQDLLTRARAEGFD